MVFGLIHWAFAVLALTYLVTDSALMAPLRINLARGSWFRAGLLYCPACFGFWAGCFLHCLWPYPGASSVFGGLELQPVFHAIDSGLAALVLGALWGKHMEPSSFEAERGALALPGDDK